ncbi:cysteine proteinase [Lentinus tigrinus ALCF2SS1-7]|uniref:Cysteine proteinase n=1 Tax=Lentinus tigrinus ALCF2SS1-6 TaxID=1328759 RepID=A0A5C2S0I4_9APHY|nr:cysteine proteinase [Lentinus tigrinus ALCF2SS1-6]RPD71794.1 cysteine proteinase [Lentinus tigrinus ALCF2SS1-7]
MIKHKHKKTPQEIYWERKRREEEERDASLPPGLINHGNTCFMNSTLQGLIATRPLHDLVHFQSVPQSLQPAQGPSILARRSPQLTNGHGRGGDSEMAWTEGMPLGDIFTTIMNKAWDIQDAKRRETMSPKEILTTIGRKYDQYLDFRQQDAHEFLRHMLDAMRMEELDIIKKRQPPPPKTKRKRSHRVAGPAPATPPLPSPSLHPPDTPSLPPSSPRPNHDSTLAPEVKDEDKLESFVDMLFGGQLASILVCEKCKKVSVTYEDFNDLSLSIKPEDYVKGRKRDRIKKIARKLRIRPPSSAPGHDNANGSGRKFRASSVPASPVRRSSEVAAHEEEPPTSVDPRRRSFDHPGEDDEAKDVVKDMAKLGASPSGRASAIAEEDDEDAVVEEVKADVAEEESKAEDWTAVEVEPDEKGKDKKGDAWGKIARRISVSMKLSKAADRERDSRPSSRASERGRKPEIKDAFRAMRGGEPRSPRSTSVAPGASARDPPSDAGDDAGLPSPVVPASPRISSPLIQESSRPSSSRRSSTNPFKQHHRHHHHDHHDRTPARSPAPPKMSEEESAYLRRVLADVHPVTGNPLSILSQAFTGGASAANGTVLATQALWAKLGHLPGIEECLRMFTAVEILDGENMVGCHRCWKIANGTYQPHVRENGDVVPKEDSESESDSDESSGKSDQSAAPPPESIPLPTSPPGLSEADDSGLVSSPDLSLSSGRVSPASTSLVSTVHTNGSSVAEDTASISSAPTTMTAPASPVAHMRKDSIMSPEAPTFGGLPIPQISTTEVDTPVGHHASAPVLPSDELNGTWSSTRAVVGISLSDDSLLTPKGRRHGRSKAKKDGAEDSGSSSEDEFDDSASDTSAATSLSDGSASPSVSPRSSVEKLSELPLPLTSPRLGEKSVRRLQDKKIPRSKQVIQRRMFKRYLISTPPPILVIHLKRFQQTGKQHTVSFSGGFKKLDQFVSFPEHLDIAPFLAPKREDFTHEKVEKEKGKHKHRERCMYRLYAVVVHIGNMLGGHYVAYTALPHDTPAPAPAPASAPGTPAPGSEKPLPPTPSTPSLSATESRSSQSDKREPRKWAYISDTVVRLTTLEEVLKAKAYICMYERV